MLRRYFESQLHFCTAWKRLAADEGVTVPEYMLVLGLVSIVLIVLFNATDVGTQISAMSTHLASLIGLGA